MSSPVFATRLSLEPRPSCWLSSALMVGHLLAMLALVMPLDIPLALRLGLFVPVCLSLLHQLRRAGLRTRGAIVRLEWESDGRWKLYNRTGDWCEGRLLADTLVLPWLIILHFACPGHGRFSQGRRTVVLAPDSLPASEHRRLRVRLRVEGSGTGSR